MSRQDLVRQHPNLRRTRFKVNSRADAAYNCVAWAAGDTSRWWWPMDDPFHYWPDGAPLDDSVESLLPGCFALSHRGSAAQLDGPVHADDCQQGAIRRERCGRNP